MKKIRNYIMLLALALVAVCCSEEDLVNTPDNSGKSGDEVQFGLSLNNSTRTVYGDEEGKTSTDDADKVRPIYWVDGDKVQIFSPQCVEGRRNAEYKVSVSGTNQDYADALTKTGAYGVQWGNKAADFYSLYPSGDYSLSSDGTKAENITIGEVQHIGVNGSVVKSDMEDCLMYAKKTGVAVGTTVELQYNPISTVLWVTLKTGASSDSKLDTWTIQSISVTATTKTTNENGEVVSNDVSIAGKFSLNISDGSFGEFAEGKNTVEAQIVDSSTGAYYTMSNNGELSIPLFIAPVSGLNIKDWKIQVVANNYTYTKTLGIGTTLKPGQIHNITLPTLTENPTEWNVSNWMTNIPRNVYLSEISIPGSWNSINPNFQTTETTDAATIAKQYSKGVRAFHLDTRWKAKYSTGFIGLGQTVTVLGLGVADGGENGSATSSLWTSGDKYMRGDDVPLVEDIISQLVSYIKTTPEEYMILVCSFAQESINYESSNGFWYDEISAICNNDAYANYIVDATTLSPNTLVGDVLGKILVIVNMQDAITTSTALPSGSKCMFTYMPSELTSTRFSGSNATTLLSNNTDYLWCYKSGSVTDESGATINTYADKTGISIYNNQAQITSSTGSGINHDRGYAPSITERTNVLNTIVNWSKSNYGTTNYNHDKWIYLGLGGYQVSGTSNDDNVSDSYSTIASTYNNWINGKVTEMGTIPSGQTAVVPYYPVGITLMNFVCDETNVIDTYKDDEGNTINVYSTDVVKNILLLNNKYRLQYDPNKSVDYNPNTRAVTNYAASATNGGDAIVWE